MWRPPAQPVGSASSSGSPPKSNPSVGSPAHIPPVIIISSIVDNFSIYPTNRLSIKGKNITGGGCLHIILEWHSVEHVPRPSPPNCYVKQTPGKHIPSVAGYDWASSTNPVSWSIVLPPPNCNHEPTLILTVTQRDPDYHQNLTVSFVAHVPPFRRIWWKSVE